jgi:hypothetical protein
MISCISWVPRGASATVAERFELSEEALAEYKEALTGGAANAEGEEPTKQEDDAMQDDADDVEMFMKNLKLEDYDNEEEGATMMLGGKTLNVFESNTEDPYIRVPDEKDLSDNEDANITASDFVFTVGTTDEDQSMMEEHV